MNKQESVLAVYVNSLSLGRAWCVFITCTKVMQHIRSNKNTHKKNRRDDEAKKKPRKALKQIQSKASAGGQSSSYASGS